MSGRSYVNKIICSDGHMPDPSSVVYRFNVLKHYQSLLGARQLLHRFNVVKSCPRTWVLGAVLH